MERLESCASAHTSFSSFFQETILATHPKLLDAEVAGICRLMEIVTTPTEEEVADQLENLAYSEDQWDEFAMEYSSAVSAVDNEGIIECMVQLRRV